MDCPRCSANVPLWEPHCPQCGAAQYTVPPVQVPERDPPPRAAEPAQRPGLGAAPPPAMVPAATARIAWPAQGPPTTSPSPQPARPAAPAPFTRVHPPAAPPQPAAPPPAPLAAPLAPGPPQDFRPHLTAGAILAFVGTLLPFFGLFGTMVGLWIYGRASDPQRTQALWLAVAGIATTVGGILLLFWLGSTGILETA